MTHLKLKNKGSWSLYLLTVIGFLAISACNPEISESKLNPEVKEYMYFEEGTYWLYKDTVSGEHNYVRVIEDSIYMKDLTRKGKVELRVEEFTWSTGGALFRGTAFGDPTNQDRISAGVIKTSPHGWGDIRAEVFFYPFNKELTLSPPTTLSIYAKYDSIELFGTVYKDVVAFHNESDATEIGGETITYFARHYGIVRKDINLSQIDSSKHDWARYFLEDYNINK